MGAKNTFWRLTFVSLLSRWDSTLNLGPDPACSEAGLDNSLSRQAQEGMSALCRGGTPGGFWCFCQRKGHRGNCCHRYKWVIHRGCRVWDYTVALGEQKKVNVWRTGLFDQTPSKEEWDCKAGSLRASGLEEGIGCIGKAEKMTSLRHKCLQFKVCSPNPVPTRVTDERMQPNSVICYF